MPGTSKSGFTCLVCLVKPLLKKAYIYLKRVTISTYEIGLERDVGKNKNWIQHRTEKTVSQL